MEHLCHGCGAAVEDSAPFCGNCGAPQIRFSAPEPESDAVVARSSPPIATATSTLPSSLPPSGVIHAGHGRVDDGSLNRRQVGGLDRQIALRSALNASVIAAVLSLVPTGVILGPIVAGYFCVTLYRRRSLGQEPSKSEAFRLGMLCGALGFALLGVLAAAAAYVDPGKFRSTMLEGVQWSQARNPSPQTQQAVEYFATPHGFVVLLVLLGLFTCVMFVLLSGLGGTISASIGRRRNR